MSNSQRLPNRNKSAFTFTGYLINQTALGLLTVLVLLMSTGCSSLPSALSPGGLFNEPVSAPVSTSQPQYLVDMTTSFSQKQYRGNISSGATVQKAIEESGAIKKFRSMDVTVARKIEGVFQPLKMTCLYNANKRMITPETDYALKHGDRILVTPQSQNQLLQALGSLTETQ